MKSEGDLRFIDIFSILRLHNPAFVKNFWRKLIFNGISECELVVNELCADFICSFLVFLISLAGHFYRNLNFFGI